MLMKVISETNHNKHNRTVPIGDEEIIQRRLTIGSTVTSSTISLEISEKSKQSTSDILKHWHHNPDFPTIQPISILPPTSSLSSPSSESKMVQSRNNAIHLSKEMEIFQAMDHHFLYQWPIVAVVLIHLRLLLFQVIHQSSDMTFGGQYVRLFTIISVLSLVLLLMSLCFRQLTVQIWSYFVPSKPICAIKMDNVALTGITTCFVSLLLLVNLHDQALHRQDPASRDLIFAGHIGCMLHNEFMFYVMMMPYLLYCRSVHASAWAVYISWGTAFISVCISLMLTTAHDHFMYALPYASSLTFVSLAILVNKRRKRVFDCAFFRQFEDMKNKHNDLSAHLEQKQKDIATQRYILANTAHDMKTPILATISGCELLRELVNESCPGNQLANETIRDMINTNKFILVSINRCMDYAKVADGIKLVPKYETCHVEESIRTVLHCLSSTADKDQVRLAPLPSSMCSHILTDKQWLQENILCLLSNAVKFTPHGKIDLRLNMIMSTCVEHFKTPSATMDCSDCSSMKASDKDNQDERHSSIAPMILVEVEDNGVGISKDMQSKLFAPFQQAQKNAGGTGLGLYSLAKRVEALGGKYGVRDRTDGQQGSLFWFTFPYRPDAITANIMMGEIGRTVQPPRLKPVGGTNTSKSIKKATDMFTLLPSISSKVLPILSSPSQDSLDDSMDLEMGHRSPSLKVIDAQSAKDDVEFPALTTTPTATLNNSSIQVSDKPTYRILLADDTAAIRNVLTKILQRGGHEVVAVANGLEAIKAIEQSNQSDPFDAIILDLHMPVLDGIETMRRIRALEQTDEESCTKHLIIGCSANDDEETISTMLDAGADRVLSKPFTLTQFEQCVQQKH